MANPKSAQPRARNTRAGGSFVLKSGAAHSVVVALAPEAFRVLSPRPSSVKKLAEALGQAITRSQKFGREGGFTVTVDATGNPEITVLPETEAAQATPAIQSDEAAFEAARQRGRIRAAEILDQEDMLSADEFAERLGVTRVTVNTRRQKHELLGLDGAKRGYRFPAWQVDEDGKAFEALPRLFELLGPSPWGVYRFLTQHHNALGGATGKDALRRGRSRQVIDAAESLARGDFA